MIEKNNKTSNAEKLGKVIDDLTLFDDDLMTRVFRENIPATQLVLRIILGKDINVISVKAQEDMKNPVVGGRDIRLDIHALDEKGEEMNIEVQGGADGAHVRRARFHSSVIDSRMLKQGEKFQTLKDSYVIFIYKHDKYGLGLPIYSVDRVVLETGQLFNDGSHIIYVNGKYKGDDAIGKLIQDFHAKTADKMNYEELAKGVNHFKEEKGREEMCESVEKYAKEYAEEYAEECVEQTLIDSIQSVMKNVGCSIDKALDILDIKGKQRTSLVDYFSKANEDL